jgi:HK97 gp10 family phage protein
MANVGRFASVKGKAGGRGRASKYAQVIGDDEMYAFIKKMDSDQDKGKLVKKGLQQAGKIIVNAAKANARSVNAGEKIIKALRVMDIRKARKKYFFGVKLGVDYRQSSKSSARHAHFLEFGTAGIRYTKKHETLKGFISNKTGEMIFPRWVGPMPARPYWRPAVDQKSKAAQDDLIKEIKIAMAQYISKNASGAKFN